MRSTSPALSWRGPHVTGVSVWVGTYVRFAERRRLDEQRRTSYVLQTKKNALETESWQQTAIKIDRRIELKGKKRVWRSLLSSSADAMAQLFTFCTALNVTVYPGPRNPSRNKDNERKQGSFRNWNWVSACAWVAAATAAHTIMIPIEGSYNCQQAITYCLSSYQHFL